MFSERWLEPLASVLGALGSERAWVVHGADGMDELTTTGPTSVAELKDGSVSRFTVTPEDAGLERAEAAALKGGEPADNAAAIRDLLAGAPGAFRDVVRLNAAAALVVAGKAGGLAEGAERAGAALDDGSARRALERLVAITNRA